MRETEAAAVPFSFAHLYSLVDRYALLRILGQQDPALAALFNARYIGQFSLLEATGLDPAQINPALMETIERVGFTPNAPSNTVLRGDEVGLISNDCLDHNAEPLRTLIPALQRVFETYLRNIRASEFPNAMVPSRMKIRSFATSTKDAGYHVPHLHTKCAFVMSYYVRVPDDSKAILEFGRHNMIRVTPFHSVTPAEGEIFIFPSWFMHGTTPVQSTQLRANIGLEFEPLTG